MFEGKICSYSRAFTSRGSIGLAVLPELQEGPRRGHHLAEQGSPAELGVPSEGDAPDLRQRYGGWNLCLPSASESTGRAEQEHQPDFYRYKGPMQTCAEMHQVPLVWVYVRCG